MAVTNAYTTLAAVRAMLGITNSADTTNDTYIEAIIDAVSRSIDDYCHRRFFTTTADETRYYEPIDWDVCYTDDILSITTLKTDDDGDGTYETTWATTDYDTKPDNSALDSLPIMWLAINPNGDYDFPTFSKAVQIVGKFGYCATASPPKQIVQAALIESVKEYKLTREAPFNVSGSSDTGTIQATGGFSEATLRRLDKFRRII